MSAVKSKRIPSINKATADRFWSCVTKAGNDRGCWLWNGSQNSKGYGRFFVGGKHYYAQRVSWSLAGHDVPTDLQISHACDNPLCVNPDHLAVVDNATNQRNAKLKRNLAGKRAGVKKPSSDFPLFPHASGRWCKKIRGKFAYFGPVDRDPKGDAALQLWFDQKDELLAGRTPRVGRDGLTVKALCDRFCGAKEDAADAGELSRRTFADYVATARLVAGAFGRGRLVEDLAADDFESLRTALSKRLNCVSLGNEVTNIRSMFKYAFDCHLIERPVRFGPGFKKPAKRILRAHRQRQGPRMFEARQIRRLIKAASPQLRAMILLGVNCGFGNHDCGTLPLPAIDLRAGWVRHPRPKTSVERRCPLMAETLAAIQAAIAERPEPLNPAHANLTFITRQGGPWAKATADSPIAKEFRKLLDKLGMYRPGLSFYALRHTFETIAGEGRDQVAVDCIMGHADATMAGQYRERISDGRLQDAVGVVRAWLFRRTSPDVWRSRRPRQQ